MKRSSFLEQRHKWCKILNLIDFRVPEVDADVLTGLGDWHVASENLKLKKNSSLGKNLVNFDEDIWQQLVDTIY